jgi:pimeloyl-ACP methyl ester carboxylesterase
MTRRVVLVPGLWMPRVAMLLLSAQLERRGYAVRVFPYSGRDPYAGNLESLARFAQEGGFFVGHSLGGVLVLDMLNRHPEVPAEAVVLLGAPVRGCLAGRRFGCGRLGRWMLGASRALWEERAARWTREAPLGIVAGTVPLGLARTFGGALPGPNDGVVRVEETTVEGMRERALVRQAHSSLIASPSVGDMAERFLQSGRFS